ncbi:Fe-S cluster assembly ATPase SufC [Erysipelotrichaceae bacterium OttesenSCG-928-M19]|nr:Fe-S cluster assembly ATPase SufC [Erysipelotrichaceae bacterium OttesenSCG-928-M19]
MSTLKIENLHVSVEDKQILKGINLVVNTNEFHAIMGPNGNGKSTLLLAIMGHPKYQIDQGDIYLDDTKITELSVDERARLGIFLGMQYPTEVSGVTNSDFLRAALNAQSDKPVSVFKFAKELDNQVAKLEMKPDLAFRYLNEGFSGGEKKRNEILHMKMLKPKFALLDEIDSGLDVDALKIVSDAINEMKSENFGCLIVSHYERLFEMVTPTHVHILVDGKIVKSGGYELVQKIDQEGYDWIKSELGIEINNDDELSGIL